MNTTTLKKGLKNPGKAMRHLSLRAIDSINAVQRRVEYWDIDPDPLAPIWVDPNKIKYCVVGSESQPGDYHADIIERFEPADQGWNNGEPVKWGALKAGDWDKNLIKVDDLLIMRGIRERFIHDIPWEETTLFETHISRIESGYTSMGCSSREELLDRYDRVDELFHCISSKGYQSQPELGLRWRPHREVIVNIGRNGELLFNGQGRHRLAISKVLGLNEIAVSILVRHTESDQAYLK